MKILFITPYVPSRIRVRPFHFIKELAERHEVHLAALGEGRSAKMSGAEEMVDIARELRVTPHSKLRGYLQSLVSLPTRTPMCAAFCWSAEMKRAVDQMLARQTFDIVHIEHIRAAHFAPLGGGTPIVFDAVDCLAGLFRQMARRGKNPLGRLVMLEEAWKLRRYEPRTLRRFDRAVITSETERDALLALDSELQVEVVPNGVDTDYFKRGDTSKSPRRVVFSGKMGYSPNAEAALWFAENVFPALRARWPDAEYVILGNDPPPRVAELARVSGIIVTGYVDDLRPYLDSASVAVAPMQVAVGVQNKVLEAMAMALPVVVSPLAARGVGESAGQRVGDGVLVANERDEWVEVVSRLFDSPDEAARLGIQNRADASEKYSWKSCVRELERIYRELATRRVE